MADISLIIPQIFSQFQGVTCAMSTRRGGVSGEFFDMNLSYRVGDKAENVDENRKRFFTALNVDPRRVAFPKQCHSNLT